MTSTTANVPKTRAIEELLRREIRSVERASGGVSAETARGFTQTVTRRDFLFQFHECRISGETLLCSLSVTNTQGDRKLIMSSQSRAIDARGRQFEVETIHLAGKTDSYPVEETLVTGVPTSLSLTFNGVSADTGRVALLEVNATVNENGKGFFMAERHTFLAQFRDIPVHRQ